MGKDTGRDTIPSQWLTRFAEVHLKPGDTVLEIAAGMGRNTQLLLETGARVTACDIIDYGQRHPQLTWVTADLENAPWPFDGQTFDWVVGINYLSRPLKDNLISSVRPGGFFLYETFGFAQTLFGMRPRHPDHLLNRRELIGWIPENWNLIAFEEGCVGTGNYVQRIFAQRPGKQLICSCSDARENFARLNVQR